MKGAQEGDMCPGRRTRWRLNNKILFVHRIFTGKRGADARFHRNHTDPSCGTVHIFNKEDF